MRSTEIHTGVVPRHDSVTMSNVPRWQAALILIGFPAAYLANSFMPWSYGLFVTENRSWYVPFVCSIAFLHWLSVGITVAFLKHAGVPLTAVGFRWKSRDTAVFALTLTAVGALLVWFSQTSAVGEAPMESWQMLYPATQLEHCLWVFVSLTAGFCEEFIYRGFGIRVLQAYGWRTWQAVALATVSFVFIHGIAALFAFPFYAFGGLFFAGIFLWTKRLGPGMYIHGLLDLAAILAI